MATCLAGAMRTLKMRRGESELSARAATLKGMPRTTEGPVGKAVAPAYGPSFGHCGIVNHLYADGSVQAISTRIDPCAYWFMSTKNGGDPYHPEPP
jgi:hypothetical protein